MAASAPQPFEFFEHTADVGLAAYGDTLPELFQNAGLGLMALLVDPETVQSGGVRDRIEVQATDRETLLVHWLNEVLFLYQVQQMVFSRLHITSYSDTSIQAQGEGELLDPGRHRVLREIKAVTFHDVRVEPRGRGWAARVVLDV
jgi:SHS2 domain-containing protein